MNNKFDDLKLEEVFEAFPVTIRKQLLKLRDAIFEVASSDPKIGAIEETLKWGQPAYLTSQTGSGTTIRLGVSKGGDMGIYVHCQTSLIADFKILFEKDFEYDGNRGILLNPNDGLKMDALHIFIKKALTYHLK